MFFFKSVTQEFSGGIRGSDVYYLTTPQAPFAHLGNTPLRHMMSTSPTWCNVTTGTSFLAELLLCYLTGNIFGVEISCRWHADDMQTACGWHESKISGQISLADDICHLHIICTSSTCRSHVVSTGWQQLCIKPTGFLVEIRLKSYQTAPTKLNSGTSKRIRNTECETRLAMTGITSLLGILNEYWNLLILNWMIVQIFRSGYICHGVVSTRASKWLATDVVLLCQVLPWVLVWPNTIYYWGGLCSTLPKGQWSFLHWYSNPCEC